MMHFAGLYIGRWAQIAGISLTQQALAILATYGSDAHLWMPGEGTFDGIDAANFIESIGTSAAAVDGPVGYVGDAGKTLGAELVTNGDFRNGTTGWSVYNSSTLEVVNGELKVTSTTASYGGAQQSLGTHPVGKVFEVSWTARKGPQNQPAWLILSGVVGAPINNLVQTQVNQSYTVRVVSSGAALVLTCQCQNVAGTESFFDNISVREIVGAIPATQSTTASKPILRRGAVNRVTASNDFASWAPTDFSFADSGVALPFGSGNATRATLTASPGSLNRTLTKPAVSMVVTGSIYAHESSVPFTLSVDDSTTTNRSLVVCTPATGSVGAVTNAGTFASGAASVISVGGGWYRFVLTTTTNNGANYRIRPFAAGTVGESVVLAYAQIEYGATASPYIPTTTAAASSPTGPMYWEMDGTDSLDLTAPVFQSTDDQYVMVVARHNDLTGYQSPFAPATNTATSARMCAVVVNPDGSLRGYWTNDAGTTVQPTAGNVTPGELYVASARKIGNNVQAKKNNGVAATGLLSGAFTANTGRIGAGFGLSSLKGGIYVALAIKGNVSDAEDDLLRRWGAQLAQLTF